MRDLTLVICGIAMASAVIYLHPRIGMATLVAFVIQGAWHNMYILFPVNEKWYWFTMGVVEVLILCISVVLINSEGLWQGVPFA